MVEWVRENWAYLRIVLIVAALAIGAIVVITDTPDDSDDGQRRDCVERQLGLGRDSAAATEICG